MRWARGALKLALRLGVSLGLLAWLLSRTDVSQIGGALMRMPAWAWAGAFLLYLFSQVLSTIRWYILSRALEFGGRLATYFKYYFVGMFFNLFLPTSIGGDVIKMWFLARGRPLKLKASYSILADRLFGFYAMFLIAFCAVTMEPGLLPPHFVHLIRAAALAMTLALAAFPALSGIAARGLAALRLPVPAILSSRSLLAFWRRPASMFWAVVLSVMLQLSGMSAVAMLAGGLQIPVTPLFYFAAFPLVAVITVLPISLSGFGVREGGFVFFLGMKGVSAEAAITLSLSFYAVQAAAALIGGAGYLAGVHKEELPEIRPTGLEDG